MARADGRLPAEDSAVNETREAAAGHVLSGTYRSSPVPGSSRFEELRLDVDGRYPQATASGTVRASAKTVAHWVATLSPDGPHAWSGTVWYRRGASGVVPHTRVAIRVVAASSESARTATVEFSGAGAVVTRTYRYRSPYFHPVNFEFDAAEGEESTLSMQTCAHPNRPPTLTCENLTIQTVFRRAGFDVSTSSPGVPIPLAGAGADALWSDLEMHDAMQAYWSRFSSRAKWALWAFFASLHVPDDPGDAPEDLGGIMFDDIGPNHRQGTAIFTDSFISQPPPGDPEPAAWARRMTFWCACHEMGHAFNLAHSWQKALGTPWIDLDNEPEARSFMNYPYNVGGGETAFFDDFEYRFSGSELLFMRHAPAEFVRMGDAAWFDEHAFEGAAVSPRPKLQLALRVNREPASFEFMEPVTLELKLTNLSRQPQLVDRRVLLASESMTVVIKRDGRPARQHVPYARYCWRPAPRVLDPEGSLYESLFVSAGLNGWDMAEPGQYSVQVALSLGGEDVVSNPLRVRVLPPRGYEEEHLAQDFFSDEVGRVIAVDGSRFLTGGNDILREVSGKLAGRRVALHAQIALGKGLSRDSKQLKEDAKEARKRLGVGVLRAQPKEARDLLNGALCERATEAAESLGHVDFKWYVDGFSRWLAEQGDPVLAAQSQDVLYKALAVRQVGGRKVLDSVLQSVRRERDAYAGQGKGGPPRVGRSKRNRR